MYVYMYRERERDCFSIWLTLESFIERKRRFFRFLFSFFLFFLVLCRKQPMNMHAQNIHYLIFIQRINYIYIHQDYVKLQIDLLQLGKLNIPPFIFYFNKYFKLICFLKLIRPVLPLYMLCLVTFTLF